MPGSVWAAGADAYGRRASWWARLAFGLPQREIVTVTTNVPGHQQPLYGMGRRLVEIIPYVPIATTLRTGIAIFSYCGTVTFGITGDFAANPDLEVLARGIESDLSELLAAAQRHQRRAAIKGRPAMTHPWWMPAPIADPTPTWPSPPMGRPSAPYPASPRFYDSSSARHGQGNR